MQVKSKPGGEVKSYVFAGSAWGYPVRKELLSSLSCLRGEIHAQRTSFGIFAHDLVGPSKFLQALPWASLASQRQCAKRDVPSKLFLHWVHLGLPGIKRTSTFSAFTWEAKPAQRTGYGSMRDSLSSSPASRRGSSKGLGISNFHVYTESLEQNPTHYALVLYLHFVFTHLLWGFSVQSFWYNFHEVAKTINMHLTWLDW